MTDPERDQMSCATLAALMIVGLALWLLLWLALGVGLDGRSPW